MVNVKRGRGISNFKKFKEAKNNANRSRTKNERAPIMGVPSAGNTSHPPRPLANVTVVETAECTKSFGYAQRNPFEAFADKEKEVCMPDVVVLPTSKRRLISKGSGSTGTTGVGYIGCNAYAVTNDQACGGYTTSASVGTTATAFSAFTNTASALYLNSEFANADLGSNNVERRTAACGMRIRYKGTTYNEGGTVYAYRTPSNTNLFGLTADDIIPLSQCKRYPFEKGKWTTIRWKVTTPSDQDFTGSAAPAEFQMILIIVAATGDAQPFEWEIVNFHELVGSNVSTLTESHTDPVGFGAVQAVGARGNDSFHGKGPSKQSVTNEIGNVIKESTSFVKSIPKYIGYAKNAYDFGSAAYNAISGGPASSMPQLIEAAPEITEVVEAGLTALSIL